MSHSNHGSFEVEPSHPGYSEYTALPVSAREAALGDDSGELVPAFPAVVSPEPLPIPEAAAEPTPRELHRAVWTLAWPSVMTMLLQTFNSLMDTFFVGHLPYGAQALAAAGVGGNVIFLMVSLAMGVTVAVTALVARFTGAGDHDQCAHATGQGLTLAFLLALLFGVPAYAWRTQLVGLMLDTHHNPQAAALCVQFLGAALLGTVPLFLMNVFHATFRGLGDTRTPMLVTLAVIATHITFNALLIYGKLGFPALGVAGAGTALAISQTVGMLLFLFILPRYSSVADALQRKHLILRPEWAWRILRIGLPAALQAVIRTLSMTSFIGVLARAAEGAAGVAALQIGLRAESVAFMPGFGYSVAASALVGQSLGARNPERAERYGWAATGQAILVMSTMAALFFLMAHPFTRLFTGDLLVRRLGVEYLQVIALSEPFLALGMVLTGALQGAGDTLRPTAITIFTMWILRLPLAYWLMFHLHMNSRGAWIAMAISTVAGGLLTVGLFRSDKWKRIKV